MKPEYKIEVQRGLGQWQQIRFKDLHIGDNFRMFNEYGDPIENIKGEVIHHATGMPEWNEQQECWEIDIEL